MRAGFDARYRGGVCRQRRPQPAELDPKTGGNLEITRLLAELLELDEITHGDEEESEPLDFEDTEDGWLAA
jgi:hypothetical protein